ncbi:Elongator complex protein 2 [Smittium culicis]|uniref:Elongator complex protein 2 n=1 Tax=Smittium culicis TaxID=133412 RepID=A0A1R1XYM5_9FUNG|nr:Elongator complex protein 2 [Smittium culicis]
MVSVDVELISGASNRVANCLSMFPYNESSSKDIQEKNQYYLAYGVGNSVAITDPKGYNGIICTLQGHTGRVTCTAILEHKLYDLNHEIISGSSDNTLKIWTRNSDSAWECTSTLTGHTGSILNVSTIELVSNSPNEATHLLVTSSVDGLIKVWKKYPQDGHEDWITSLSSTIFFDPTNEKSSNSTISHWKSGDVILSSGSQDRYCRLWRISAISDYTGDSLLQSTQNNELDDEFNDEPTNLSGKSEILAALNTGDIYELNVRIHKFASGGTLFTIEVESVLSAHDGWIHSVSWKSPVSSISDLQMLTSSADQSLLLWKPESDSGVWACDVRFGEIGGASFGFFNGIISNDGNLIAAVGYHGSLHFWNKISNDDGSIDWVQDVAPTGHFDSVTDIVWEPSGRYFLTHSSDKTSRIFGKWVRDENYSSNFSGWHEISRPQIHGYDLTCATFISPLCYASGADEKVVRIFDAPSHFVETFNKLCAYTNKNETGNIISSLESLSLSHKPRPIEASIPPLGLSNKAIFQDEVNAAEAKSDSEDDIELRRQTHVDAYVSSKSESSSAVSTSSIHPNGHPPLEETLRRRTLWPETEKLYGHPYETFAIASNSQVSSLLGRTEPTASNSLDNQTEKRNKWLAVSCKSASAKHAGIRMYDSESFRPAQRISTKGGEKVLSDAPPLLSHNLTVTSIAFKPLPNSTANSSDLATDETLMLSVGRDRSISLFKAVNIDQSKAIDSEASVEPFELVQHIPKAHTRIIWGCCWSPDGIFFGTASRDKTVSIWLLDPASKEYYNAITIKTYDAATSISITNAPASDSTYWIAVGLENGEIVIYSCSLEPEPSDGAQISKTSPTKYKSPIVTELVKIQKE